MEVQLLSKKYIVKKLKDEDISSIFSLCKKNKTYYKYCPPMVSEQSIKEDMLALPKHKTLDDKYFVGFYDEDKLIAIMDLITNYPNKKTCFIGLLMLNVTRQNKGIGSLIVDDIKTYLKELNYKYIRLAWIKDNKQAEYFWKKNGFVEIKETRDQNNHIVIEAIYNIE